MFPWGTRTFIAGIVNCSPDSFSGDGHRTANSAIEHGLRLAQEGADLLDVGGQSTRPGAQPVPPDVEWQRVAPVIEALVARAGVPVSVDTFRAEVARASLQAGATIVNDVRALLADPELARVIAEAGATVVLMDNRLAPPDTDPIAAGYAPRILRETSDAAVVQTVADWLAARVAVAQDAGITKDRILIDPGLGFGKTTAQSLALVRGLTDLRRHPGLQDIPFLVGPSRKGFIGRVLGLPVEERLEGTLATIALAIRGGADVIRVHDVRAAFRCARMADAIVRAASEAASARQVPQR